MAHDLATLVVEACGAKELTLPIEDVIAMASKAAFNIDERRSK